MQQVREVKRQRPQEPRAADTERACGEPGGTPGRVPWDCGELCDEPGGGEDGQPGVTDAFEEAFRDDAVLGQLKTKLETGLEDMMTFFESGSPFDGIEMVTSLSLPWTC